jgi:endonuclease/exonuclease/phosphatase family metal-dependent hydrolase
VTLARVATFNIRHGLGRDDVIDLDRTAATILEARPDLLALQEVDVGMRRSGRVDQAAALGELTGLRISFRPTLSRGEGRFGLAIGAAAELEPRLELLPRLEEDEERRGALVVTWGGRVVIATHLSLRARTRAEQTRAVADMARRYGAVIVMGDLNQQEGGLGALFEAGFDPGPDRPTTLRTRLGRRRFDFVLAGGGARVRAAAAVDLGASDHSLVVAEVELA